MQATVLQKNSRKLVGITLKCLCFEGLHFKKRYWESLWFLWPLLFIWFSRKKNFLRWIETLLTKSLFQIKKGTGPGDLISAYLFIYFNIRSYIFHSQIEQKFWRLNIFYHKFPYTPYAEDTTFFKKDKNLVFEILNIFHSFLWFLD